MRCARTPIGGVAIGTSGGCQSGLSRGRSLRRASRQLSYRGRRVQPPLLRTQIAHRLGFQAATVCTCEIHSREGWHDAKTDLRHERDTGRLHRRDRRRHRLERAGERRAIPVVARPRAGERHVAVRAQAVGDDELLLADRRPAAQRYPGADRVRGELATPKVVFSSTIDKVDWNTRLVTGDAVAEITRLKAEDGGPMGIGGATLAGAAMRAGLIDEYTIVTHPVLVGGGTRFLHGAGQLGEPEPGGDADVSRRRGADPIRGGTMSTGQCSARKTRSKSFLACSP